MNRDTRSLLAQGYSIVHAVEAIARIVYVLAMREAPNLCAPLANSPADRSRQSGGLQACHVFLFPICITLVDARQVINERVNLGWHEVATWEYGVNSGCRGA